ncbi:MAG TPA: DUF3656 domain-containing protein [Bryobacteraceae bacterium]|nr:DUF3656 domain-containing protein [Bryobacteraceae bacterium]
MSPAGYWPQLRAAIEAGADAIYFGLKHFTARAKVGFALAELPEALRTLHRRGVKGYITFNTLVFEHELEEAARTIGAIAEAGADALIVQDVGVVKLARRIAPELELHASTQMSVTDAEGVRMAQELGVQRVTLARELSLDEIRAIRAQTDCELEIFVHGALCVAYSGQCFSSEAWGGRSANRGQCAQACRLPYELIVDDAPRPLADARYLLSPGDLYTLEHIPEIVAAGVSTLKIEGRYKDENYVALTTSAYRRAVDEAWAGLAPSTSVEERQRLEQVYSRGLGPWFLTGTNHQAVVKGRAPRHRGVLAGRVARIAGDAILIQPVDGVLLKNGDGVVFDAADWRSPEEREEGGRIYEIAPQRGGLLSLRFGNKAVDVARIRPGDLLWRTDDPEIEAAARPYTAAVAPVRRRAVQVRVTAVEGRPLVAEWSISGRPAVQVCVESAEPLGRARNRALDADLLREQFGRLGNTPYELGELTFDIQGAPFAPASLLNDMRRDAVDRLQQAEAALPEIHTNDPMQALRVLSPAASAGAGDPRLHLLVRTPEQLEAALECRPASITLDYLDLYGLRPSVERVKQAGLAVRVASPRILKPGEEKISDFLMRLECPILVRSAGLLHRLEQSPVRPELIGDFSLNAANSIAAAELLAHGLTRITPTHDLNGAQVSDLARAVGAAAIEAIAYQHLPVFHTEHCVFCRFLSTGTSYLDCGRPCEKHRVAVRDTSGRAHPVMADVGCRNTVFGSEAQEASGHLRDWRRAGIAHYRLEFAHESAREVRRVTHAFADTLDGRMSFEELGRTLRIIAPQGVTEGSLFVPAGHFSLPVLQ